MHGSFNIEVRQASEDTNALRRARPLWLAIVKVQILAAVDGRHYITAICK